MWCLSILISTVRGVQFFSVHRVVFFPLHDVIVFRETLGLEVLKLREQGVLYNMWKKWWLDYGQCGGGEIVKQVKNAAIVFFLFFFFWKQCDM